jgi:hypothetical protein
MCRRRSDKPGSSLQATSCRPGQLVRPGHSQLVPYLERERSGPAEFLLYLRKSNGRKAVPRQRAIITAYILKLGGRIIAEFPDAADGTVFRRIDGE